jgi:hypothetical protein
MAVMHQGDAGYYRYGGTPSLTRLPSKLKRSGCC